MWTERRGRGWRALFAGTFCWAASVAADPCEDVEGSVVVVGSSAVKPLLAELARLAVLEETESLRIYYKGAGSCAGVSAVLQPSSFTPQSLTHWSSSGDELNCEVQPTDSVQTRIGVSDVFAGTCRVLPNGLPSNVADIQGPVQTMVFAVPNGSSERTISAEAAYYVFGFGADSGVPPWEDPALLFHRDSLSGTQSMMSVAIGVPADRWRGTATGGTTDVVERLLGVAGEQASAALGIISATAANQRRATLRTLAFQD